MPRAEAGKLSSNNGFGRYNQLTLLLGSTKAIGNKIKSKGKFLSEASELFWVVVFFQTSSCCIPRFENTDQAL